ncbi:MAG TPA: hypothetical protein PKM63_17885 [Panacibacter sp.]|nr:hypothetical protein [Panacibacter sp.]HNP46170.1 hypothetical protein [Panacibacter sp.]
MKQVIIALFVLASTSAFAQKQFSKNEVSFNGFRNPSIGLEYRHQNISVHAGYYITAFEKGVTTKFIKTGATVWFCPVGKKANPSSFYAGASWLRGLNLDYKNENALGMEAGFRWMVWKGLNLRIGAIGVAAKGHDLKINPTPGISYSIFF